MVAISCKQLHQLEHWIDHGAYGHFHRSSYIHGDRHWTNGLDKQQDILSDNGGVYHTRCHGDCNTIRFNRIYIVHCHAEPNSDRNRDNRVVIVACKQLYQLEHWIDHCADGNFHRHSYIHSDRDGSDGIGEQPGVLSDYIQ